MRLPPLEVLNGLSGASTPQLSDPSTHLAQAISRHLQVLETAGLITRGRDAQRRPCRLVPATLEALTGWIDGYRLATERNYRNLDAVLETLKEQDQ